MIKAEDILHAWTRKTRAVLNPSVQESLQQQVKLFVELTFRTEQPKALSRCEREREQHTNKKEALVKAEAEFRLMDVNKLPAQKREQLQYQNQRENLSLPVKRQQ